MHVRVFAHHNKRNYSGGHLPFFTPGDILYKIYLPDEISLCETYCCILVFARKLIMSLNTVSTLLEGILTCNS